MLFDNTRGIVLGAVQQKLNGSGKIVAQNNEKGFSGFQNFQLMNLNPQDNQSIWFETLPAIGAFSNRFDRLIVAGHTQNLEILQHAFAGLKTGAILVFFSQFLEALTPCYEWMVAQKRCIMVQTFDIFTRTH